MRQITADDLNTLYEYYNRIVGTPPGIGEKLLIRKYAESYGFFPFEFKTVTECFLKEYDITSRKLFDVPIELWLM